MKQLWLHTVRGYIRLGLFFYFKNIKAVNVERVPKTGAVLFLANHQNALLDALLIATKSGRFSYFLTRASVFQNGFITKILKSLLMLPVYRLRDGWNNLSKNNAIFSKSAKLLSQDRAVAIFPEGSHNLNRTVRPLSKGFTRVIFEVFERYPKTHLQLVPVGFNYLQAEKFGDCVSLNFGDPIHLTINAITDKNESRINLKAQVHQQICQLTSHIETENYDTTLKKLKDLKVDFLKPEAVNSCMASNFENCEPRRLDGFPNLKRFFKFCLILALLVPYLIWKWGVQPKIQEIEFVSTFRFAVAISIVPIYILILTVCLLVIISLKLALLYLFGVLILTLLTIKL
ncbi:MAG TPA: 1-acyl-sn-glycerol-3-phosphate acyltransferase [Flavobacteriaceae bacterium]